MPETNTRMLGLKSGGHDIVNVVPLNQAKAVEEDPNLTLEVAPSFRLDYVYMNHRVKPLDDKRIRLAMNYAANLETIKKIVYFGYGTLPNSYMPIINYHCEDVARIPYDPEKAKQLLAEAGYDGSPIELIITAGEAPDRQTAQILQQGWKEAGLNIELVEYDFGTGFGKVEAGDYQAMLAYITSDTNDQDFLASIEADFTVFEGFFSGYNNSTVTEWLIQARRALDPGHARGPLLQSPATGLLGRLQRADQFQAFRQRLRQSREGLRELGHGSLVAQGRLARQLAVPRVGAVLQGVAVLRRFR